jgi:glycosyltransferase involved in cell wall biosynthesis
MRVAYDARPLTVPRTGIGRYVHGILDALLARPELEQILLCSPREVKTGEALARDPRVKRLIQKGWKGNIWLQAVLPFFLEKQGIDLFHATLFLLPLLYRCRAVINLYDLTVYRYPQSMEWKNRWILRAFLPRSVNIARKIVTLSDFTRREIECRWPESQGKVVVIPGAPSLGSDAPPGNPVCGADADRILRRYGVQRPYILYVGTVEPRKNIGKMLDAYCHLRKMGVKSHQMVLAGPPGWGLREILRSMERSDVRPYLKWLGYVPDGDLVVLYEQAELFLYLSFYEGFGFPPLEAMASGTCVVAANRGSMPECLGNAAVLVDPFNTNSIAENMVMLIKHEEMRMEYVQRGYEHCTRFSWEKSADKTLGLYRELLA